jgi:dihydrofolate synthase/folylpolyglutamate synthase
VAVVEVGLGGRLDATNVLTPSVSAVTNVGLDHTDLLGETIAEIAAEKGGIAKTGVPFLTTAEGEALAVLRECAARAGAPFEDVRETIALGRGDGGSIILRTPARDYDEMQVALAGAHQEWNAALAVRLAEIAEPTVTAEAVRAGLAGVVRLAGLRGRGEVFAGDRRIVVDVAHNADGWRATLSTLGSAPGRLYALVGVMADKDASALGAALVAARAVALPVDLPSPRALGAPALEAALTKAGVQVAAAGRSIRDALDWFRRTARPTDQLLVTGSHITVAEALRVLG